MRHPGVAADDPRRGADRDADVDVDVLVERMRDLLVKHALAQRLGACAARNDGLAHATTPDIALTADDAWWPPGALRDATDLLDRHPRLAVVNPRVIVGHDFHEDPACAEMTRSPLPRAPDQPGQPLLSFVACAVIVRRAAVLAVDGFCERLEVGGEEELLGWDLAASGWQMSYADAITAHHCPPPSARRTVRPPSRAPWSTGA